ncbi:MAG TPA: serine hydrolase domain-containing protein [Pyrinomonadaceae bacterium]|jgi:CubicO group peptidase (beta-lactamase class C family)|nr:serine hydrolase domain-containing protein [Pyrinomonadaceae bacterium]
MKNVRNNSYFFFLVSLLLLACSAAYAQDKPQDKNADLDKIFSGLKPDEPGCAVAVSQNGKVAASRAYGMADMERSVQLTPDTIFDAGSVVKQFVAASVLLLVEDGRLSLSEDIRKYIPELPDTGHKVTLDHLLTHTSGVRDWRAIQPMSEGDPTAVAMALCQHGLNFVPGEEWGYSNTNYELLKEIVARTSGMSFTDFTQKRLWEPLKMKSTLYLHDMADVVKNRALAYKNEKGKWKLDMYFGNQRGGSGGLLTTAGDLLIWNEALTNGRLGKFVTEKLQEPAILNNGRKLTYARGLNVDTRGGYKMVWHSGAAAGYSSLAGRLPEHGISFAIMCNVDEGARSAYASRIFDLFLPPAAPDPAANVPNAPVAAGDLSARAGLFFNEKDGQPLRLVVSNNTLAIAGGGPLVALAADRFRNLRRSVFFMSEADFELQFLSADRFEIKPKEGAAVQYRRARDYKPTAAELSEFAGRYESNEMGAVIEVLPEKGGPEKGLIMRFYRNPSNAISPLPVDRDTFMLGMTVFRFVRDKDGKVTGYDYSNPALRNIRYARLKDR